MTTNNKEGGCVSSTDSPSCCCGVALEVGGLGQNFWVKSRKRRSFLGFWEKSCNFVLQNGEFSVYPYRSMRKERNEQGDGDICVREVTQQVFAASQRCAPFSGGC